MEAKVAVIGTLIFPPEKVAAFLPHLRALIGISRLEQGCLCYDAAVDIDEPGVIRISELWLDQACLERHIAAPHVPVWRAALDKSGVIESRYVVCELAGARVV